jgi:hypothetical protein
MSLPGKKPRKSLRVSPYSLAAQPESRAIRPEDHGRLPGVGLVLFVLKTLDHGIATALIDDSEPTVCRIHLELGGQVRIVH